MLVQWQEISTHDFEMLGQIHPIPTFLGGPTALKFVRCLPKIKEKITKGKLQWLMAYNQLSLGTSLPKAAKVQTLEYVSGGLLFDKMILMSFSFPNYTAMTFLSNGQSRPFKFLLFGSHQTQDVLETFVQESSPCGSILDATSDFILKILCLLRQFCSQVLQ